MGVQLGAVPADAARAGTASAPRSTAWLADESARPRAARRHARALAVLPQRAVEHGDGARQDRPRDRVALCRARRRTRRVRDAVFPRIVAEHAAHAFAHCLAITQQSTLLEDNPTLDALDPQPLPVPRSAQSPAGRAAAPLPRAATPTCARAARSTSRSTASPRDCATAVSYNSRSGHAGGFVAHSPAACKCVGRAQSRGDAGLRPLCFARIAHAHPAFQRRRLLRSRASSISRRALGAARGASPSSRRSATAAARRTR